MLIEVLLILVVFILVLSIALKIPGLEVIIRPVFALLQKFVEYVVTSAGSWVVWLIQCIIHAHRVVFTHLCHDEEYFDIRLKVDRANRRS